MNYQQRTSSIDAKKNFIIVNETNRARLNPRESNVNARGSITDFNSGENVDSSKGRINTIGNSKIPPMIPNNPNNKKTIVITESTVIVKTQENQIVTTKRQSLRDNSTNPPNRNVSNSKPPSERKSISSVDAERNNHQTREGGKHIDKFYEKYQQNLKKVLEENKKDIDLIGNERFKGVDANYLLEEMNQHHMKNKFNDEYIQEKKEIDEIEKILNNPDCSLTKEQREYLINKRKNFEERIELTPLPIAHRKSLENADVKKIETLNKAQRSAVVMRRYEYELNMKKLRNKKSSIKNIPIEETNDNKRLVEYLIFIRRITIIQRFYRLYIIRIHVREYFDRLFKFFRVQRSIKFFLRKIYFANYLKKLKVENEFFEIIKGNFRFLKRKYDDIDYENYKKSYNSEFKQLTFKNFNLVRNKNRRLSGFIQIDEDPSKINVNSFSIIGKFKKRYLIIMQSFIRRFLAIMRYRRLLFKEKPKKINSKLCKVRKRVYMKNIIYSKIIKIQKKIRGFLKNLHSSKFRKSFLEMKRRSERLDNFILNKNTFINSEYSKKNLIRKTIISSKFSAMRKIILIQSYYRMFMVMRRYNINNINKIYLDKKKHLHSYGHICQKSLFRKKFLYFVIKLQLFYRRLKSLKKLHELKNSESSKILSKAIFNKTCFTARKTRFPSEFLGKLLHLRNILRVFYSKIKFLKLKADEEKRLKNTLSSKMNNYRIENSNDFTILPLMTKKYNKDNFVSNRIQKSSYSSRIFAKIILLQSKIRGFLFKKFFLENRDKMLPVLQKKVLNATFYQFKKSIYPLEIKNRIKLIQNNFRIFHAKNVLNRMKLKEKIRLDGLISSKMKYYHIEYTSLEFDRLLKKSYNNLIKCEVNKFSYSMGVFKKIIKIQAFVKSFLRRNFFHKIKDDLKKKVSKADLKNTSFTAIKKFIPNRKKQLENLIRLQNILKIFISKLKCKKLKEENLLRERNIFNSKQQSLKIENSENIDIQHILSKKNIAFVRIYNPNIYESSGLTMGSFPENGTAYKNKNILDSGSFKKISLDDNCDEIDKSRESNLSRGLFLNKSEYRKISYSKNIFPKIVKIQAHFRRFLVMNKFDKIKDKYLIIKSNKVQYLKFIYKCKKLKIPTIQLKKIKILQNILRLFLARIKFNKLKNLEISRKKNLLNINMKSFQVENSRVEYLNFLSKKNVNISSNIEFNKRNFSMSTLKKIVKIQAHIKRYMYGNKFDKFYKKNLLNLVLKHKQALCPNIYNKFLRKNIFKKINIKQDKEALEKIVKIQSSFRMFAVRDKVYDTRNPLLKIPLIKCDINGLLQNNIKSANQIYIKNNLSKLNSFNEYSNGNNLNILTNNRENSTFELLKIQMEPLNGFGNEIDNKDTLRKSSIKKNNKTNLAKLVYNDIHLFRKITLRRSTYQKLIKVQSLCFRFLMRNKLKRLRSEKEKKQNELSDKYNNKFLFLKNVLQKYPFREKNIDESLIKKKNLIKLKLCNFKKIKLKTEHIVRIQKNFRLFMIYNKFNAYKKNIITKFPRISYVIRKAKKKNLDIFRLVKLQWIIRRYLNKMKKNKILNKLISKDKIKNGIMKRNFRRWHRKIMKIKDFEDLEINTKVVDFKISSDLIKQRNKNMLNLIEKTNEKINKQKKLNLDNLVKGLKHRAIEYEIGNLKLNKIIKEKSETSSLTKKLLNFSYTSRRHALIEVNQKKKSEDDLKSLPIIDRVKNFLYPSLRNIMDEKIKNLKKDGFDKMKIFAVHRDSYLKLKGLFNKKFNSRDIRNHLKFLTKNKIPIKNQLIQIAKNKEHLYYKLDKPNELNIDSDFCKNKLSHINLYYNKLHGFVNCINKMMNREGDKSKRILLDNLKEYNDYLKNRDFYEEKYVKILNFFNEKKNIISKPDSYNIKKNSLNNVNVSSSLDKNQFEKNLALSSNPKDKYTIASNRELSNTLNNPNEKFFSASKKIRESGYNYNSKKIEYKNVCNSRDNITNSEIPNLNNNGEEINYTHVIQANPILYKKKILMPYLKHFFDEKNFANKKILLDRLKKKSEFYNTIHKTQALINKFPKKQFLDKLKTNWSISKLHDLFNNARKLNPTELEKDMKDISDINNGKKIAFAIKSIKEKEEWIKKNKLDSDANFSIDGIQKTGLNTEKKFKILSSTIYHILYNSMNDQKKKLIEGLKDLASKDKLKELSKKYKKVRFINELISCLKKSDSDLNKKKGIKKLIKSINTIFMKGGLRNLKLKTILFSSSFNNLQPHKANGLEFLNGKEVLKAELMKLNHTGKGGRAMRYLARNEIVVLNQYDEFNYKGFSKDK